jgi:hypothetical protein
MAQGKQPERGKGADGNGEQGPHGEPKCSTAMGNRRCARTARTRLSPRGAYLTGMLTSERVGLRRLEVSLFARNRALHFLARRNEFNLLPVVRKQLTRASYWTPTSDRSSTR